MSIAWREGYEAYYDKLERDKNPYSDVTDEYFYWDDGWCCAERDGEKSKAPDPQSIGDE